MAIPSKVEQMDQEADELLKKMQEEFEGSNNEEDLENSKETVSTEVEQSKSNQNAPTLDEDQEDWKHKYEVLQGKYNAEVPALNQQVKLLMSQVETLTEKLNNLDLSGKYTKNTEVEKEDVPIHDLDLNEFIEQYPDIYRAMEKIIETKYNSKISQLEEMIKSTNTVTNTVVKDKFYDTLTRLVPDWQEINVMQDFMDWVQEIEPFSGLKKYDLLMDKFKRNDANGVAYFFNSFKNEKGLSKKQNVRKINDIVSPEPAKSKNQSVNAPTYNITDINELNRQIREALTRRDYKKADELEKRIDEIMLKLDKV